MGQAAKHHPVLIRLLTDELQIKPDDILDFELCLADHVPGVCSLVTVYSNCSCWAPQLYSFIHTTMC